MAQQVGAVGRALLGLGGGLMCVLIVRRCLGCRQLVCGLALQSCTISARLAMASFHDRTHLFRFRTVVKRINGGVLLLRPCPAVEAHMLSLLDCHPKLRYVQGTAEQDFFGWCVSVQGSGRVRMLAQGAACELHAVVDDRQAASPPAPLLTNTSSRYYRYTGMTLSLHWSAAAEQSLEPASGLTVGGVTPRIGEEGWRICYANSAGWGAHIGSSCLVLNCMLPTPVPCLAAVHYTRNKPFGGPQPGGLGHQYLCSLEELRLRASVAARPTLFGQAAEVAAVVPSQTEPPVPAVALSLLAGGPSVPSSTRQELVIVHQGS